MTKKEFYNILVEETGYEDSYEDFDSMTSTPEGRKEFYDILVENTGYEDDYEWFESVVRGESNTQPTPKPVSAVQSPQGGFYDKESVIEYANSNSTSNTQAVAQANKELASGEVTATPTAPSAPKAEDITTTKATATTAEAPKVESTARPVSAVQKADGTSYNAEELQGIAGQQQGSAPTQATQPQATEIAEQPKQEKATEEVGEDWFNSDDEKFDPTHESVSAVQKADGTHYTKKELADESRDMIDILQDVYGKKAEDAEEPSSYVQGLGYDIPVDVYNLPTRYADAYFDYADKLIFNYAVRKKVAENDGKPLDNAQLISLNNELRKMDKKQIQELIGNKGMNELMQEKDKIANTEKHDLFITNKVADIFNTDNAKFLWQLIPDGNDKDTATVMIASRMYGDKNAYALLNDDVKFINYAIAKALGITRFFGEEELQYYLNSNLEGDEKRDAIAGYAHFFDKAFGSVNLPANVQDYIQRSTKDIAQRGELGTTDGDARVNDILAHVVEYGEIKNMLSDEDEAIVLERVNKTRSPHDQIKSIEDACFGGYDLNWRVVKEQAQILMQQRADIGNNDTELARLETQANELRKAGLDEYGRFAQEHPFLATLNTTQDPFVLQHKITTGNGKYMRELDLVESAITLREKANDIIEHGERDDDFLAGVYHGFVDKAKYGSNWDFGMSDLKEAMYLKQIVEKVDKGEKATKEEESFLEAWMTLLATQSLIEQGRGYKAGATTAEAIPFMIEMIFSPIKGGSSAASKFARWAIKRYGKKLTKKPLLKTATRAIRVVGDIGKGIGHAVTTGGARTAADAIQRNIGEIDYTIDEDGGITYTGRHGQEDATTSIIKAIGSNAIEYHSELVGEYFSPLLKGVSKLTSKGMSKIGLGGVNDFFSSVKHSDWGKMVSAFQKRAKWTSTPAEFAEEIVGGVENAILIGDQTLDTNERGVFNTDNLIDTYLGVAVMGTMMQASQALGYKSEAKRMQLERESWNRKGVFVFGDKEWSKIQTNIDNSTHSDITEIVTQVINDKKYNSEQKKVVLRYASAVASERVLLDADAKRAMENQSERAIDAQSRIEEAENEGANITDVNEGYNTQIRENMTGESLARMVGVTSVSEAKDVIAQRYGTNSPMEIAIEVANDASLNDSQRKVILDYYAAVATNQGKQSAMEQKRNITKLVAETVSAKANNDMGGQVVTATKKVDGSQVTIIAGEIVTNEDGSIDKKKSDDAIVSVDANCNKEMISLDEISGIATYSKADVELKERAKLTQELEKAENISDGRVSVGDVVDYGFRDENGTKVDKVEVKDVTTDDKGNRWITFASQGWTEAESVTLQESEFNAGRDRAYFAKNRHQLYSGPVGLPTTTKQTSTTQVAERIPKAELTEVAKEPTQQESVTLRPGDLVNIGDGSVGEVISMPEDGKVIVMSQDRKVSQHEASKLEVVGSPTEATPSAQTPQAPQAPSAPQVESTPAVEQTTESAQQVESTAIPTAQVEIPTDAKGNKVYEQAPIEDTINDIYNDPELDEDEADAYVQAKIDGATKRIEAIDKKKPKMGEDRNAYVAQRDAWRAERGAEQASLDYWQGVQAQRAQSKANAPKSSLRTNEPTASTASATESKPKVNPVKVGTKRNANGQVIGLIDSPFARALNNETRTTLNRLGEALGVSIHIVPRLEGANAKIEGNRITLALDAEQGPLKALGHELLHRIKALSPKAYEDFADVIEKIVPSFKSRMIATRLVYSRAGRKIDMELLREEVVADLAGEVMYHAGLMKEFVDALQPKTTKQRIMEVVRDVYARIRGVFEGEIARSVAKAERVLLDAMKKANKVVRQDETTEADSASEKLSIIGESGVSALDQAEEATIRMDNLAVAREMEDAGKDAKAIRMATGWEHGADGKWRYEIDDIEIKDLKPLLNGENTTLADVVDGMILKAYPQLKDVSIDTNTRFGDNGSYDSSFHVSKETIELGEDFTRSVLVHEIQHAIQEIEGWSGGKPSPNNNYFNEEKKRFDIIKDILKSDYSEIELKGLFKNEQDRNKKLIYLEMYEFMREGMSMDDIRKFYMNEYNSLDARQNEARKEYLNTSGEVEARNVQSRIGMTPEQRRATLLAETEDVAREDQIFLMENSGASAMAESANESVIDINEQEGQALFSLRSYNEGGRDAVQDFVNKQVDKGALTQEQANEIVNELEDIYNICEQYKDEYAPFGAWSDAKVVTDERGVPVFSVIKKNGDYGMNLDFSLVCKKRRTLDAVFQEMINRGVISNFELGQVDIARINDIIREHGFETACRLCFVDSKRFRTPKVADDFANLYNELVEMSDAQLKKVIKGEAKNTVRKKTANHLLKHPEDRIKVGRDNFITAQGFEQMQVERPEILKLYNQAKGSGGPKASFGDTQYMNDIQNTNWTPEKAYAVGGVRLQSFSDYVPRMVFDYVQLIADLASKGLPVHAYTKEPIFAKQFGLTGVKINLSLVPRVDADGVAPGLDKDGNYAWQEGESFPYDEAVALQNAEGYKENVGTIAVGVSDAHIAKLLDDPNIRMVIPYHKSGLNKQVAIKNNIDAFNDYTTSQNTRKADGTKVDKKGLKGQPDFNQDTHNGMHPRDAAQKYLDWCDKKGYLPKFDQFRDHPNYYKLLEDFTTIIDENGAEQVVPQGAVKMQFPTENDAFGSMESLVKEGLEEDAILEGSRQSKVGDIVDEIEDALADTKYSLRSDVQEIIDDYESGDNGYLTIADVAERLEGVLISYDGNKSTIELENILNDYKQAQADAKNWGYRMDSGGEEDFETALYGWLNATKEGQPLYSLRSDVDARKVATEVAITSLEASGIEVVEASDAMAEVVMGMGGVEMSAKKKRTLETASVQEEHQPTVVSSADGAKVLNNLDNVATEYEEKSNQSKTFLGDVAKALGAERKGSGSQYVTFETKNGKVVTIRLSNHNATVSNFDNNGEADGISIVVSAKGNNGMTNDGDAHVVEHYYDAIKLRRAEGKPLADIVRSIKQALHSGEFADTTGLAERQEVNLNEVETLRTPQGEVYGWTDGKKVYLTKKGMNPETPIHEYTHIWARAMMQKNAKGWQSVKGLLRDTPMWNEVLSDANYADIRENEDAVASEVISRLSGKENAKRMESEAQRMIDEAKGVFAKAEAVTLIERMRKALKEFWSWVGKSLFDIKEFGSIEEVTDRVLYDLVNNTELETAEGVIEKQVAEGEDVKYSIRTKPEPKNVKEVYKLFNVDENGMPQALFIDADNKLELGVWYDADSPEVKDLESLEPGKAYLINEDGDVVEEKEFKVNTAKSGKKSISSLPSKEQVIQATKDGNRWMTVRLGADGERQYHTLGINGAGGVTDYALRPGWHATDSPSARHIGKGKSGANAIYRKPNQRWFKVEISADHDYNEEAREKYLKAHPNAKRDEVYENLKGDITDKIPEDGFYNFKTNSNANPNQRWFIAGAMKIIEPLTEEEAHEISRKNGVEIDLPYKDGVKAFRDVKYSLRVGGIDVGSIKTTRNGRKVIATTRRGHNQIFKSVHKYAVEKFGAENVDYNKAKSGSIYMEVDLPNGHDVVIRFASHTPSGYSIGEIEHDARMKGIDWRAINGRVGARVDISLNSMTSGDLQAFLDLLNEYAETGFPQDIVKSLQSYQAKHNEVSEALGISVGLTAEDGESYSDGDVQQELDGIVSRAKANGTYMKAPNGEPTNLTEEQWANVRTKAFKNWFGDWENDPENASKVVDENGEPMVVYHQTNRTIYRNIETGENWDDLDWRKKQEWEERDDWEDYWHEEEFYEFNRANARTTVEFDGFFFAPEYDEYHEYGERTIEAFLNIRKPASREDYHIDAQYNDAGRKERIRLQEEGYDGVIREEDGVVDEYVAFEPNQIKSATDNVGSYLSEDNDIRYSLRSDEGILFRDGDVRFSLRASDGTREEYNKRVRRPNRSGSVGKWDNLGWRMKEAYQDSMLSLKELQEVIAKKYGLNEIPSWMDAYMQENLMSSRNKAASDVYRRDFYTPMVKEVQALVKEGVKYEDLVNYMIAKHGLERNVVMAERDAKRVADEAKKKGEDWQKAYDEALKENRKRDYSGLTALTGEESVMTAEKVAEEMVEEFEAANNTKAMWEKVNAATKETLRKSYEGGLMDQETYESIESMYEHYIPLRGWDSDIASDVYEYLMSDRPLLSPALKTAKGRTSLADDPIATIGMMADSTIAQANRNKMKQAFYYFAMNHPSDVVTISKQWYVYDEATKKWHPRSAEIPMEASSEEIATIVEEFEARMEELAREGKAKHKSQGLDLGLRTVGREGEEHTVRVKVNGEEYCIYVNGSPRAAQALNGLTNPEMFNDALMKGTKKMNNYLAQVFTSKNPEFIFSNMARDLMWATGAVAVKENAKYNVAYHKNINKIFWKLTMPGLVHRHMMGTLNMNNELDRYFEEFVRHGGETGYTAINSLEHYKRNINRSMKEAQGKRGMTKKIWNGVFDAIEFANRSAENMTRFAVYATSRQMGRDQARAAHDAKEITVNFNKKGSGELGARYFGGLYVFMNACIQSMANFARLTGKHPVKMTGALATMAGLGFMLPLLNRMLAEAMGDDDEYWNLPEWVRRNNLVFRIPGTNKFITIPISHELRPFYGIGEIAYSVMNEKEDAKEGLGKATLGFSGMSPIDFTGNGGNVAVNLTPTAFQPVAQLIANVDYFGKPIFKDADYLEDYPEYTKAYKGTSPILVSGTEFLNRVSGGDVVVAGGIDLSPDVIEHLVESYFGGAGKTVNKAIKGFSMIWDEDTREVRNIPIVNKFLQTVEERTYGSHTQKEFYEAMDEVEYTGHKLSGYSKQATMGSIEYAEKLNELINSPEYKEYKLAMGYKSAIKKLQNSLGNIDKTKEKEVSEAIQRLQKEMLEELPKTKAQDIDTVLDNAEEVKWGAEEKVETIFKSSIDDYNIRKDAVNDAKEYGDTTALKKFIESGREKENE